MSLGLEFPDKLAAALDDPAMPPFRSYRKPSGLEARSRYLPIAGRIASQWV